MRFTSFFRKEFLITILTGYPDPFHVFMQIFGDEITIIAEDKIIVVFFVLMFISFWA